MARPVWTGSISFGLVNMGVKAFTAVRDHEVHFNQLDKKTGARVRYVKVSAKSGDPLEKDDIEMGYEVKKGKYVTFSREELDELQPASTRTVDVSDFVDLEDVDPIYYERTYWLVPDGEGAARAYRLLQAAMEEQQKVGIGTVVMRNSPRSTSGSRASRPSPATGAPTGPRTWRAAAWSSRPRATPRSTAACSGTPRPGAPG